MAFINWSKRLDLKCYTTIIKLQDVALQLKAQIYSLSCIEARPWNFKFVINLSFTAL